MCTLVLCCDVFTVAHSRRCDTAAVLNDMKFSLATAFVEPFALVQCCSAKAMVS
jgi:hypothetical protein